ncbi:MAG: rRNA cytosine-C5-methyltransferase [Bacteroides sp.]|nr:rRNA cytosine-C5-methyltransferase [Bacteroides sp.]
MELPASFASYTRQFMGDEEYNLLAAALTDGEQPVSIRLNGKYAAAAPPDESVRSIGREQWRQVPWAASGFYLPGRPTFTFDPLFHAGCYYVQEAASMFVEQALRRYVGDEAVVMLDLCAAPGGKSTHARNVLPEGSLLVANEVIRNRSQVLAENLTKWGHPGVVVSNNDPADFAPLTAFFDMILTDVPCSGEGMFRKDPVAVSEWSTENVAVCWQRQRRILADIWPSLKPGGLLIYSTCTYNTKENEENVCWICRELGAEALRLDAPDEWRITGNLLADEHFPVYRFLPHRTSGEGFFMAVLRKNDEENAESMDWNTETRRHRDAPKDKKGKGQKSSETERQKQQLIDKLKGEQWLTNADSYEFMQEGGTVSAFPRVYVPRLAALRSVLRILQAGVEVAEQKGKDWVPAHALAMSTALNADAFPRAAVSYEQAIAYLRKEVVCLSQDAPRGVVLLTYRQVPIGFVKNVGNRANNLYPPEWRIRSGYMPEEVLTL